MYKIKKYSLQQAKNLGVRIAPSQRGKYKIDVFSLKGEYITSIGHIDYKDFPTFIQNNGTQYAKKRRDLYWNRHRNDTCIRGFFAKHILW